MINALCFVTNLTWRCANCLCSLKYLLGQHFGLDSRMIDSRFSIHSRLEQRYISLFVLRQITLKILRHLILKVTQKIDLVDSILGEFWGVYEVITLWTPITISILIWKMMSGSSRLNLFLTMFQLICQTIPIFKSAFFLPSF